MTTPSPVEKIQKTGPDAAESVFDVILTFRDRGQIVFDPFTVQKGISEPSFVQAIFAKLDDDELAGLVIIGARMHLVPGEAIEGWITPRKDLNPGRRFYFCPELNGEDAISWTSQKNAELVRRQKH